MTTTSTPRQGFDPALAAGKVPHYGDPLAEAAALRDRAAIVDRSYVGRLALVGADRQRFLNGLVTCDVKALTTGRGAYGFFTDPKGRVLADLVVVALAEALWLELPPGSSAAIAAHLRKYIIADRVEVLELEDRVPLTLAGPQAAAALGEPPLDDAWQQCSLEIAGASVICVREGRLGVPGFTLWVQAADAAPVRRELLGRESVLPAGFDALEMVRVEGGVSRYGQDFGAEHFPQETGAEAAAVSYTKGCYLGQEVVARIHYRGGVQRALRGLRFAGDPPPLGTQVLGEGRESGAITSIARSPRCGAIGLGVLHQRVGEVGSEVRLENGEPATLVALPFETR